MRSRFRLRTQAATVPRREALSGRTLLTRKTSSRRPAIASPTSSSTAPLPYISAVSMWFMPSVEAAPQGRDRTSAVLLLHLPGTLSDDGNLSACRSEGAIAHRLLLSTARV